MAKRLLDFVVALTVLVVLSPLLVVIALGSLATIGWPVLFVQERAGLAGCPFRLLKFRSMTAASGSDCALLPDDQRVSRMGAFLRKTSLDELPELWNVLVGQMSLVGPRPLLLDYLPLYTSYQSRRHEVPPGLTGWAQINGRNTVSWEERFALDVWYVDNHSLLLDVKILCITVWRVLKREGVYASGGRAMPRFTGTPDPCPVKQDSR